MFSLSDSIQISSFNTPLDTRTRVANLNKLTDGSIQMPYVGLPVWVTSEEKVYVVTGITGNQVTSYQILNSEDCFNYTSSTTYTDLSNNTKPVRKDGYVVEVDHDTSTSPYKYILQYIDGLGIHHKITVSQSGGANTDIPNTIAEVYVYNGNYQGLYQAVQEGKVIIWNNNVATVEYQNNAFRLSVIDGDGALHTLIISAGNQQLPTEDTKHFLKKEDYFYFDNSTTFLQLKNRGQIPVKVDEHVAKVTDLGTSIKMEYLDGPVLTTVIKSSDESVSRSQVNILLSVEVDPSEHSFDIKNAQGTSVGSINFGSNSTTGIAELTFTDGTNTFSAPLPSIRYDSNTQLLKYTTDGGEHWQDIIKMSNLQIKEVAASTSALQLTPTLGDLVLIGDNTNGYELNVFDGTNWQPIASIDNVSLQAEQVSFTPNGGLTSMDVQSAIEEVNIIKSSDADSDLDLTDESGNVLSRHSEGHFKTKNFDSRDVEKIKQNTGISKYDEFDVENDYAVDDVVLYGGLLYKFTSAHTAGAWDDNDVEHTTVIDELDIDVDTEHPVNVVAGDNDLEVSDSVGHVVARLSDGHFKTLHFDSRYVNTTVRPIKKCVFMGDSITHGVYSYFNNDTHDDTNRYNGFDLNPKGDASFRNLSNQSVIEAATAYQGIHYYFGKMMCCDVVNLARRGSGFVHDGRSGGTFCDLIFGNANKTSGGISAYDFTDVDLVCVFFGINDYINNKVLATCVGELERGVREILRENPLCKIVIFSPYNAWGQVSQGGDYLGDTLYGDESTNYALGAAAASGGYTLQAFVDAIDTKCNELGIQHVPLSKSNVCNRVNIKDIMIDGLHPSKESYLMLAAEIYGKVNYGN